MIKETRHLTKDILIQFYVRHQGLPWFNDFIQYMNRLKEISKFLLINLLIHSDICEILILAREDAGRRLILLYFQID